MVSMPPTSTCSRWARPELIQPYLPEMCSASTATSPIHMCGVRRTETFEFKRVLKLRERHHAPSTPKFHARPRRRHERSSSARRDGAYVC